MKYWGLIRFNMSLSSSALAWPETWTGATDGVHDHCASAIEVVDHARYGALVAGDDPGRKNDHIAGLDHGMLVFSDGDL